MGRYTGPNNRISRRLGFSVLETGKEFTKGKQRKTKPGQHGASRGRKLSNYGQQLVEKQKIRFLYGISEKQLKNTYKKALKLKGSSALNLLFLLESRFDNIVYRMGFARTRRSARQLVNHGHFLIDGKKNNIPSTTIKVGQKISLKEKSKSNLGILESIKENEQTLSFVKVDKSNLSGNYLRLPERAELNQEIKESAIIEYYNR